MSMTMRIVLGVSLSLLVLLLTTNARVRADDDADAKADAGGGRTYALLIGCTEYPKLKEGVSEAVYRAGIQLAGCANDVDLMRATLIEQFDCRAADITVLKGWPDEPAERPTRANIEKALAALAARAYETGDRVIVLYAGHGVQQPDDNGDELDGLDEAWLPADASKDPSVLYKDTIRDEVLGAALAKIQAQGASVWCIMDCCHSASGTRGPGDEGTRTRGLDPAILDLELRPTTTRGVKPPRREDRVGGLPDSKDGLVVFFAAQSFQEVPEIRIAMDEGGQDSYGLLTTAVVRALKRAGPLLTFDELREQVAGEYRSLGKHHIVQPYAEGDLARRVFGRGRSAGGSLYVRVNARPPLELSAGRIHGITQGTQLDVFEAGQRGSAAHRLGRVEVKRVGPTTSQVVIVSREDDNPPSKPGMRWPAEIVQLEIETALPLALVDADGHAVARDKLPADAKNVLDEEAMRKRFPHVDDPTKAKWILIVDEKMRPDTLHPVRRSAGAPRFDARHDLWAQLMTIYKAESLLRLAAQEPNSRAAPGNIELRVVVRKQVPGGLAGHEHDRIVHAGERLVPGDVVDFAVARKPGTSHGRPEAVDLFVFWIDMHFGVQQIYPQDEHESRLSAKDLAGLEQPRWLGGEYGWLVNDNSPGVEHLVMFVVPVQGDGVNLGFLAQPPAKTRAAPPTRPEDPAAALLWDLSLGAPGTRGGGQRVRTRTAGMHVGMFAFASGWGPVRAPDPVPGTPSATVEAEAAAAKAGAPPMPQATGTVRPAQAGTDGAWCLLVATTPTADHVFLDLDGTIPADRRKTPEDVAALAKPGAFDAEMAVRVEQAARRTTVWYDRHDLGAYDLVLVDNDGDQRADERWTKGGDGGWKHETGIDEPLLHAESMQWYDAAANTADGDPLERALSRIGTIAGR